MQAPSRLSVTGQVRMWLRENLEGLDYIDNSLQTALAVEHFKDDEEFVERFLEENLYPLIAIEGRRIIGRHRKGVVEAGGVIQSVESFEEEVERRVGDFGNWWEHAGGYVRLPRMTRPLVATAIEERQRSVRSQRINLMFMEKIHATLPNDEVEVGEYLTNDDLGRLLEEATREIDGDEGESE